MPKFSTNPIILDNVLQLNITYLKQCNYFEPNQLQSRVISWIKEGEVISSITIMVNTENNLPFITLNYNYENKQICYSINIISKESNLNKGEILYFQCPVTNKLCRKLYFINGCFLHREAMKGTMYHIQTESKQHRAITRKYKVTWKGNGYDQLNQKYFKAFYNGKPTKKYLRIVRKIEVANSLPHYIPAFMR